MRKRERNEGAATKGWQQNKCINDKKEKRRCDDDYLEDENLVTAFVPSEMACLESSPGRMSRTEVWISRDEMVDFLLSGRGGESQRGARREEGRRRTGGELGSFFGDSLEEIRDEGVEDEHGLVGDSGVGVDLLEDLRKSYRQQSAKTQRGRVDGPCKYKWSRSPFASFSSWSSSRRRPRESS